MNRQSNAIIAIIAVVIGLSAWIMTLDPPLSGAAVESESAAEAFERGPHGGRLLRDGEFSLEITVFEQGVPPQFRVYPFSAGKPLAPEAARVEIAVTRLDGEVNRFSFKPEGDHLNASASVEEPHSFDVKVAATAGGKSHTWAYQSYEGRTAIVPEAAAAAGIGTETAGAAVIRDTATVAGRIVLDPSRSSQLQARFPGLVREVRKGVGDSVKSGEVLAVIESNESLQSYQVRAPFDGIVIERTVNVGAVAGEAPIMTIADVGRVIADLYLFPGDVARVRPGQTVKIKSADGAIEQEATVTAVLPVANAVSQTVSARVVLDNAERRWHPGMTVRADITTGTREAALAVKRSGLQRFRDFTVVFAKVGNVYEVRMLELGAADDQWVEVLSGLKPGTVYVAQNSFLIKADIEKSGASHDH